MLFFIYKMKSLFCFYIVYSDKPSFFCSSIPNLGMGYSETHGIPRKEHFFWIIMKTIQSLFHGIFSERKFYDNHSPITLVVHYSSTELIIVMTVIYHLKVGYGQVKIISVNKYLDDKEKYFCLSAKRFKPPDSSRTKYVKEVDQITKRIYSSLIWNSNYFRIP